MVRSYNNERARQDMLRGVARVAVLSKHMQEESVRQGVALERTRVLPLVRTEAALDLASSHGAAERDPSRIHLAFIGRMERLKGPALLVDALAQLTGRLPLPVTVTFAGDGRERAGCQAEALQLQAAGVDVRFTGWLTAAGCASLLQTVDLLVVPSVWPEPLGLVGLEAAAHGVPAVAFDVGGIAQWLQDDVTGRLVGGAPSASTLAVALDDCMRNRDRLRHWGSNARRAAQEWTVVRHVDALEQLLATVVHETGAGAPIAAAQPLSRTWSSARRRPGSPRQDRSLE
jgi:glycosyltransferase involved in cell wall biosynthesis